MLGLGIKRKIILLYKVNWVKTLYFNFRKFPFKTALRLPIMFYGSVKFQNISGKISINGPIEIGMIGFGQEFEINRRSRKIAEIVIEGDLIFNGPMHIGKDVFLYIAKNAVCNLGYMSCLGSNVRLVCMNEVVLGDWARIGYQSQITDTNSHPMMNTLTGERYPMIDSICIGSYNSISNRVTIMPGTKTPDYCVIGSNSLCNKDYTSLGNNILIGGVPAKLIKENFSRDWESEEEFLKYHQLIWQRF